MCEGPGFVEPVTVETLEQIGLFGALDRSTLAFLAETLKTQQFKPGDVVFREGDQATEMYVVLRGEFEVLKASKRGIDARVAMLGNGDWFGEMSILDVHPRSASVRSLAASRLLVMTASDLEALYRRDLKSYSLFALNVARELSRRLRVADGILADLVASLLDDFVSARHGSAT
jgi:CRP-like cAMP-binding protein